MKVVHISYSYGLNNTGGAAIAATRLHLALLKAGVESHFVCMECAEDGPNVHVLREQNRFLRRVLKSIYNVGANIGSIIRTRNLRIRKFELPSHLVGIFDLEAMLAKLKPDVVHVHWINPEGLSWRQLKRIKCPVVFHMHDMYMFTTAFGYVWDDERYITGFTRSNSTLAERYEVCQKRKVLVTLQPVMVGPSRWICKACEGSVIGHGRNVTLIPNVMEEMITYKTSVQRDESDCVLLFGCYQGTKNPYKGWQDLVAALKFVSDDVRRRIVIRVFGEEAESRVEAGTRIEFLGKLKTPEALCAAYNEADVFVMPSRQDNAPSVKFEALMCGLPVLVFDHQGCAEDIDPKMNGWISPDGNVADYARGIEYFYGMWESGELKRMKERIASSSATKYSTVSVLGQYLDLYEEMSDNKCAGIR